MGPVCEFQTYDEDTDLWGCSCGKDGAMRLPCRADKPCYKDDHEGEEDSAQ